MAEKRFRYLVADTTAFINTVQINEYAENILTVPDVVAEVRNKRQLRRLVTLPYDLQVKVPDTEALTFVTNFAKKTGDYASLSAIDLKVIALTYMLEKEHVGTDHIRTEPIVSKLIASKNKPEDFIDKTLMVGFYHPNGGDSYKDFEEEGSALEAHQYNLDNKVCKDDKEDFSKDTEIYKPTSTTLDQKIENSEILSDKLIEINISSECEVDEILIRAEESDDEDEDDGEEGTNEHSDNENDDDTWITPLNLQNIKKQMVLNAAEEDVSATVACMSTDYAIQNVIKQLNLNVAALDGKVIKNIRTYILRCYSCFKTTSVMTKVFCPNCGHKTLKRVAVSYDESGHQVIHINTRRPLTAKFKNQSIPRPRGGKHSCNPILSEDQPIPNQMPSRVAKTKTNALDEDYLAGYSPFATRDIDSRSALLKTSGNIKQWARNNEYNQARRRKMYCRVVK